METKPVPTFDLYGEILSGANTDPLHYETIKERSSQHDWTIRVHKHNALAQIFLFKTTGLSLSLNGSSYRSLEPMVLFVPPNIPHGFSFPEDVIGDVLTIPLNSLEMVDQSLSARIRANGTVMLPESKTKKFTEIVSVLDHIKRQYYEFGPHRSDLLKSLAHLIALYISSEAIRQNSVSMMHPGLPQSRQERYADAFCQAVEANFSDDLAVDDYASIVGISAPHLTRICRNLLGISPNQIIRKRRILEAKRLLQYTRMTAAEISIKSGFSEPAYFNRAFRSVVGCTPLGFRNNENHKIQ